MAKTSLCFGKSWDNGLELMLREVTKELLSAFRPYLLPQAAAAVEAPRTGDLVLGAVYGSHTCGGGAGRVEGDVLVVYSLYVDSHMRRRGVGARILEGLLQRAHVSRIEARWTVDGETHREITAFLHSCGFLEPQLGERVFRLDIGHLRTGSLLRRAFLPTYRPDANVGLFSTFAQAQIDEVLADETIDPRLSWGRVEGACHPNLALGYVYGGKIVAYVGAAHSWGNTIAILAVVSRQGAPPGAFFQLMAALLFQIRTLWGEDAVCYLSALSDYVVTLARRITGDCLAEYVDACAVREIDLS